MSTLASVLRSILQPVLQGWDALLEVVSSAITPIAPEDIFEMGDVGYVFDPADYTRMFQDSAASVAVTALYQPVGYIGCQADSGNFMAQPSAPKRPELRISLSGATALYLDGIDDYLSGETTGIASHGDTTIGISGMAAEGRALAGNGSMINAQVGDFDNGLGAYGWSYGAEYSAYGSYYDTSGGGFVQINEVPEDDSTPLTVIARASSSTGAVDTRTAESAWTMVSPTAFLTMIEPVSIKVLSITSPLFLEGGFFITTAITDEQAEGIIEFYKQKGA